MTSVLDRPALEGSPLADLHVIANELGVDGFRRLRKANLVDAILAKQGDAPADVADATEAPAGDEDEDAARRPRRGRRGGRARTRSRDEDGATDEDAGDDEVQVQTEVETEAEAETRTERQSEPQAERSTPAPRRGRSRTRGGERNGDGARERNGEGARERNGEGARERNGEDARDRDAEEPRGGDDRVIEGVVELLANGSGFVRLSPPEPTDDDVYISAAQVKRCELVSGDRIGGPVRGPRRSERFPSLVRIDTINGRPADEVAEGTRFEDLPVAYPSERIELGSEDPTVAAIEWLTPIGKGSRVVIAGPARAGKTEALRRLVAALAGRDGLELTLVLAGVRPEEIAEWRSGTVEPTAGLTFATSPDAQAQALEQAVEQGRRVAARGGDAVVAVDSLEYVAPAAARRALAAARNIEGGGSLTIIATAPAPVGGETTVVTLDAGLSALGHFPALDLAQSGTLRPELLVGDAGAEAIAKARAEQG
jgi:transcription termination factor Rho